MVTYWYPATILLLLVVGLVPAVAFMSQHRPRQWRRWEAWDASGFVAITVAVYLRSIILTVSRWPSTSPHGWFNVAFGIGSLAFIDWLLILRIVKFRQFVQQDRQARVDPGPAEGDGGPPGR